MLLDYSTAAAVPVGAWRWPHFSPAELACKASGAVRFETETLDRLERLRVKFGRAMFVNSGYRSPEHNRAVSFTGDDGPHTRGRAVDIRVYGPWALELLELARADGFTGIGVAQKSGSAVASRYLHLDDVPAGDVAIPRPALWSY